MKRYISFSSTREVAEAGAQPAQLPLRRTQEVARQSLVNVAGLTYPLLQRASMWSFCDEVDQGVSFTFNRQRPYGDVHFGPDLSFLATREPTDDEAEPPLIFLEALTWELVLTMIFFKRFVATFGRPGTFRIGLGFAGFQDAQVDWAGFQEDPAAQQAQGMLTNWRFLPPKEAVAYEVPGVTFPANDEDLVGPIVDVIAETSFAVKGLRRTALGRNESRLSLTRASIEAVVRAALVAVG
jgi:hypothetical protein